MEMDTRECESCKSLMKYFPPGNSSKTGKAYSASYRCLNKNACGKAEWLSDTNPVKKTPTMGNSVPQGGNYGRVLSESERKKEASFIIITKLEELIEEQKHTNELLENYLPGMLSKK